MTVTASVVPSVCAQDTITIYQFANITNGNPASYTAYERGAYSHMAAMYEGTAYEIWQQFLESDYILGKGSTKVRGWDYVEDWQINFINPDLDNYNPYFDYLYTTSAQVSRTTYPLILANGENVLGNDNILMMGDDNFLYLNSNGTLTLYNYPGGTVQTNYSWAAFGGGVWKDELLTDKLQYLIGYEEGYLFFLEGDSDITRYNLAGNTSMTFQYILSGDLAEYTLGDIVDGKASGYTYLGWNYYAPIIAGVDTRRIAPIPEPSGILTAFLGLAAFTTRRKRS